MRTQWFVVVLFVAWLTQMVTPNLSALAIYCSGKGALPSEVYFVFAEEGQADIYRYNGTTNDLLESFSGHRFPVLTKAKITAD